MQKIFKYDLSVDEEQIVDLPAFSKIIHVGVQEENLHMWAVVDPTEKRIEHHKILVIGTGRQLSYADYERTHLGTVMIGMYVWHVFEIFDHGNYPKIYKKLENGRLVEEKF